MLKNYFKIAWRNIVKYPFYSIVNVVGLFCGIAFTLLIGAFIWGELQVNKNLKNATRQYILTTKSKDNNFGYECATFGPLAKRLKEDFPDIVANYYRFDGISSIVSKGEKHLRENIQVGDSTMLGMYGFKLLYGNAGTALSDPSSAVISKDIAIKYFGKTDVVGQALNIQSFTGSKKDFAVTGVLDGVDDNSVTHLVGNYPNTIFIPTAAYSFFGRADFDNWNNIYIGSYIELQKGKTAKDLEKPIQQLINQNNSEFIKTNVKAVPVALTDYYIDTGNGQVKRIIYTLSFIGLFILLMAIVNFINISISRSAGRMKEIGIRKVLGGLKKQLILQFLTESIILVLIATLLAMLAYPLLKPVFTQIISKELVPLSSFPIYFIFIPLLMVLLVGLMAGLYPAFVLSSLKSVDSLKGKLKSVKENILLRKSLVGFQFSIALVVLIVTIIITQQISYFFGKSLGYNKEFIVSSTVPRDWTKAGIQKMENIRNEFAAMPQIETATVSYEIPDGNNGGAAPLYKSGSDSTSAIVMQLLVTDENYLNTYQIPLLSGSFFDNRGLDSGKVIMNETAVHALGYKNASQAIGQQVSIPGNPTVFTIKGVTKDFHFGSMQQAIVPFMFFNVNFAPQFRFLSFKIKPGNVTASIEAIQKKWVVLLPGSSFEYSFMDDALKKLYATEIQLKKAAYTATFLALIIVLLGVLGLISLSVQKRTKEIGIRKVLGSSVSGIMALFMKEFLWVITFSGLVACPIAYLIITQWLQGYAYRVSVSAAPFIISLLVLGFITAALISIQTIKAAIANPVKSLRTE